VAEVVDGRVVVHEWLKRAILLYFQTTATSKAEAAAW
jgi:hypothetical protein